MKRNDLLSAVVDGLLAFLMAIAGTGCMITAFSLQVDMSAVALAAAIFAALGILSTRLRRGWILLLAAVLAGGWILYDLAFADNFLSLVNKLLSVYHLGYGWEIPEAVLDYEDWDLTLTFQVIAACCAALAGISLAKRIHILAALATLLPVFPCIVVTDTVPAEPYLLLAILTLSLLALTRHARRSNTRQANRLTILLLIPLLLGSIVLFNTVPQWSYVPPERDRGIFGLVDSLAQYFPFLQRDEGNIIIPNPDASVSVPLQDVGPKKPLHDKMLEVTASRSGVLYLRGRSYSGYTGTAWEAYPETEILALPPEAYLDSNWQTIGIESLQQQKLQHFVYYFSSGITLHDGALPLQEGDHLYRFRTLRSDWQQQWQQQYRQLRTDNSTYAAMSAYTQLPEKTAQQAIGHLQKAGIDQNASILQIALRIEAYVKSSARYSVNTPAMPKGSDRDFALWFLDNSDTGYCIHFATAATVLLRAAGIPARYVEGYMVDARAGQPTTVRGNHAHAWVEYYVPHVGWVILEPTPNDGLPVPPATTSPTDPTGTTGPTRPTKPTRPTFSTDPTQATAPTGPKPTEPTGTTGPTEPTTPPTTLPKPTSPTVPTDPGGTMPSPSAPLTQGDKPAMAPWVKGLILWITLALGVIAVVLAQWQLRLRLRRKAMAGKDWPCIMKRWRYACLLAKLCRHQPPKPLYELLKKAKYSREGLQDRELAQFDRYYKSCVQGLRKCPWYTRIWLRLIFAAW